MPYIYTNRASAQLVQSLAPTDTAMVVQTGQGVPFPVPSGANVAQLTLISTDGTHEIVTCTQRVGDNFTIARGQESTPAGSFPVGSRVELRLTAATLNSFLSKTGGAMTGGIDFGYHRATNLICTNVGIDYLTVRAIADGDNNYNAHIQFPGGGAWPRIQNSKLLTWAFLGQLIFVYYGGIEFLPPFLKICDGTRGTPNLIDRFVICAGPAHPQFSAGGDFNLYMSGAGEHTHGGGVYGIQLEPGHIPPMNALAKAFTEVTWAPGDYPAPANKKSVLANTDAAGYFGAGWEHAHRVHPDGGHVHAGGYHPPYYSLYYVMLEEGAFN